MKLASLKVNNLELVNHEVEQFEEEMKCIKQLIIDLIQDIKKNNLMKLIPEYKKYKEMVK